VVSPVSSSNKTDRHDITEILLNVVLNTKTLTPTLQRHDHALFNLSFEIAAIFFLSAELYQFKLGLL
jgi:hypothetical protein